MEDSGMCLAVPLKLVEKNGKNGMGEFDGAMRKVRLDFVPKADLGDYVLVHAGFAIETIAPQQAEADRKAYKEVMDALK